MNLKHFAVTTALAVLSAASPALADLTPAQREEDFRVMAALYSKYYGPNGWKRQAVNADVLAIGPWLERVRASTNDLDYFEICVDYVAALQDTHVAFVLPSDFVAQLGFTADLFDGKPLIDSLSRALLPAAQYPFVVGDELISVDGKPAEQLITEFSKYAMQGNPRSTRRVAAARISIRPQSRMPHAVDVGERATVVIRRQNGAEETYSIPWVKTGTPLLAGPVPSPSRGPVSSLVAVEPDGGARGETAPEPEYMKALHQLQHSGVDASETGLVGYGSRAPVYALPAGFTVRLGTSASDFFLSGTYQANGQRIGYIRIPSYSSGAAAVLAQFDREMAFFEQNTDGLVIDQMRNPGGLICFGENIASRLIQQPFRPLGYEMRANRQFLVGFFNNLNAARANGAEQWVIDLYEELFRQMNAAYSENRGVTGPIPLCTPSMTRQPATDAAGRIIGYTKPLVILVDEFSTSTGDSLPAMLQDAGRGIVFGWRTNGAGGTNTTMLGGAYGESRLGMTLGLMTRAKPIVTPEYPTAHYVENIGVRPDVVYDYQTRENLLQQGRPFVAAFTETIVNAIREGRR